MYGLLFFFLQHKCAMYWPSKQVKTEVHGPLRVTYLDEEPFAHYTVRRFEVKPVEQGSHYSQVRTVARGHRFCNISTMRRSVSCGD